MKRIKTISPTGHIGWEPFGETSFKHGLRFAPDFIGAQAGSNDDGPLYLGADAMYSPLEYQRHDIIFMLLGARKKGIPLVIGGAGDWGTDKQVDQVTEIVREIAREHNLHFNMAIIKCEQDKGYLVRKLNKKRISALDCPRELTEEMIRRCSRITAMMGVEQFIEALDHGADVIIAGRCTDPAIFAAFPIWKHFDPGLSWYMGKVLECGCLVADPIALCETMTATLEEDHLLLTPASPKQNCTIGSVAGHSLYERRNPYQQKEPGGTLHCENIRFEQVTKRTVKVTGPTFENRPYDVKLEGASLSGYRAFSFFGVRGDPTMIKNIDDIIEDVREEVGVAKSKDKRQLNCYVYGRNAVMQELEPNRTHNPHEIGCALECVAEDLESAKKVCNLAQHILLHKSYPGIVSSSGNIAFLGSVELFIPENPAVYEYIIDHVLKLESPNECFRFEYEDL